MSKKKKKNKKKKQNISKINNKKENTNVKNTITTIKTSDKDILTRAEIKEQIDPIIIKYSSSSKDTLKKTKSLKYYRRYKTLKIKPKINNIIINTSEMENNKGWIILSYICAPYVYLMKRDSKYINYHTKKGMKLFFLEIILLGLYYFTKNTIKTKTSCDNFAHYTLGITCKATPWWVTFIWAVITLILVFVIVELIKRALTDNKIQKSMTN